jgi:hypothetical protein
MGKMKFLTAAGSLISAAALLYCVAPEEGSFYPRCLFHTLTGLHCPGCGTTRCLHALLHGDLRQAAAYNVLDLFLLLPVCIWGIHRGALAFIGHSFITWRLSTWSIWLLFCIIVAFGVLRNLPFAPFSELAPHRL